MEEALIEDEDRVAIPPFDWLLECRVARSTRKRFEAGLAKLC
jgi:hypothetical protein